MSQRALALIGALMVAWTMAACCGSLSEERMREQTAFARRAGIRHSTPTPNDPPTMPPSPTVSRGVPLNAPTFTPTSAGEAIQSNTPTLNAPAPTATPSRGVQLNAPTSTPTPGRGMPWHAPTSTATPNRGVPWGAPIETYIARPMTVTLHILPDTQDLSLSCEASAAKMAAQYFKPTPPEGFSDWEWYFIKTIPRHCNPHRGYRGKIDGTLSISCRDPQGYGTYAEPIAKALNRAGIPARVEYGVDYQRIAREVRQGRPVIVWMSRKDDAPVREFDPEILQEYVLLLGEHVWLVIGVSADNASFLVNDPTDGSQYWVKRFPRWDVFRGMSVIVGW